MGLFSSKGEKLYDKGTSELYSARGDKEKALDYIRQSAEMGYPWAASFMGDCYRNGKYVPRDGKKAMEYYEKSPYTGKYGIGTLYYYGIGVEKDHKKAFQLFEEVMAAKVPKKYSDKIIPELGVLYFRGDVVEQDYKKASEHLRIRHDCNTMEQHYCYAYMRYYGLGKKEKFEEEAMDEVEWICRMLKDKERKTAIDWDEEGDKAIYNSCMDMICEYTSRFHLNEKYRKLLSIVAREGHVGANCRLAAYYLSHNQVEKETWWDKDELEWVTTVSNTYSLWGEAETCLRRLFSMVGSKTRTEVEHAQILNLFLKYGEVIRQNSEPMYNIMKRELRLD